MFLIDVNGFRIFGQRPRNVDASVFLSEDGFEGWDETPDMRRDTQVRPHQHGEYDASGDLSARTVTLSGHVVTGSAEATAAIGRRLRGVLADGDSDRITVRRDITEWARCRLAGSTKFTVHGADPTTADWQMQLWCRDPRKYGSLNTVTAAGGSTVDVSHYGNFPATSELTMEGNDDNGYVILGPSGRRIEVNTPLVRGTPHTLDTATGQLRVGGAIKYGALGQVDLWATYPGRTTTVGMSNTDSGNKLTVNTWDTYI